MVNQLVKCIPNEGCIYHIYNRTNNHERLFQNSENREFFLRNYFERLSPYLATLSWNLLPNHFHLVVRVRPEDVVVEHLMAEGKAMLTLTELGFLAGDISLGQLIVQQFRRFFQSYAQSYNEVFERKGNLFYKHFKRVQIKSCADLTRIIVYVNANAQRHGYVDDFTQWRWSAWNELVSAGPTFLARQEVLDWFGGRDEFIRIHREMTGLNPGSALKLPTF